MLGTRAGEMEQCVQRPSASTALRKTNFLRKMLPTLQRPATLAQYPQINPALHSEVSHVGAQGTLQTTLELLSICVKFP